MPNRLDLPPELSQLIEKRESEDRREAEGVEPQSKASDSAVTASESDAERRTGADRRQASE